MFKSLTEQTRSVKILQNFYIRDAVPNTLLLSGIEGSGKKKAAVLFSMLCNCTGLKRENNVTSAPPEPCGKCRSCKKIISGNHPDIITVAPSGKMIKISQIRKVVSALAVKPYEALMRFIILHDAHKMNVESSNAILKSLEEPPDRTVFILISSSTCDLLPTIISRCRQIKFNPLSASAITEALVRENGMDREMAFTAALMSQGNMKEALKLSGLSGKKNLAKIRTVFLDELEALMHVKEGKGISISQALFFAEAVFSQRENIHYLLDIMKSYLRDLIIVRDLPENIINIDRAEAIGSCNIPLQELLKLADAVEDADLKIKANTGIRLSVELLSLRLAGLG